MYILFFESICVLGCKTLSSTTVLSGAASSVLFCLRSRGLLPSDRKTSQPLRAYIYISKGQKHVQADPRKPCTVRSQEKVRAFVLGTNVEDLPDGEINHIEPHLSGVYRGRST